MPSRDDSDASIILEEVAGQAELLFKRQAASSIVEPQANAEASPLVLGLEEVAGMQTLGPVADAQESCAFPPSPGLGGEAATLI